MGRRSAKKKRESLSGQLRAVLESHAHTQGGLTLDISDELVSDLVAAAVQWQQKAHPQMHVSTRLPPGMPGWLR